MVKIIAVFSQQLTMVGGNYDQGISISASAYSIQPSKKEAYLLVDGPDGAVIKGCYVIIGAIDVTSFFGPKLRDPVIAAKTGHGFCDW